MEETAVVHESVKHTKSRNGCVTCKARRRKCDETKPSCSQCSRRRVTCGGYSKGFRWKDVGRPDAAPKGALRTTAGRIRTTARRVASPVPESTDLGSADVSEVPVTSLEKTSDKADQAAFPSNLLVDPTAPINIDLSDIELLFCTGEESAGIDARPSLGRCEDDDEDGLLSLLHADSLEAYIAQSTDNDQAEASGWQVPFEVSATVASSSSSSSASPPTSSKPPLYNYPRIHSGSPEHIAFLFDHRICEVLCIRDSAAGNPWRRIMWPLARDHTALYHAIAAMTCFQGANRLPQFRAEGLHHLNTSIQQMYGPESNGSSILRLEVALAATLALGFAQTWYYPRSSTGIRFVKSAKKLLHRALRIHFWSLDNRKQTENENNNNQEGASSNGSKRATTDDSMDFSSLRFFANTWVYMDAIARFTCRGVPMVDTRFMAAWRRLDPQPYTAQRGFHVDPLMGTATTLFPLIGRVADLVNRVHGGEATLDPNDPSELNPPGLVAEAAELKMAMELWTSEEVTDSCTTSDASTSSVPSGFSTSSASPSDLVQTANAYKWAALLLLCQAVPELPRSPALAPVRLARRVLVLLATVPLNSRAVIFPVLPLLISGCEVDDRADRDWVRRRWLALAAGNSSGIVDRCLELTLEVWRRRDSYAVARSHPVLDHLFDSSPTDRENFPSSFPGFFSLPPWLPPTDAFSETMQPVPPQAPIGDVSHKYTIKSKQHWLSVMRDWGWEGKLLYHHLLRKFEYNG